MTEVQQVAVSYHGKIAYEKALALQEEARAQLKDQELARPHQLLGLEHPLIITLGKRAQGRQGILVQDGTPVVQVQRGGLATLHSPGQLMIYPVFDLRRLGLGARAWVELLLNTSEQMLAQYGITAQVSTNPAGLFTKAGAKIAFIGVQIRSGISTHGLSINVSNDLKEFERIQSCGLTNLALTSMAELVPQNRLILSEIFKAWSVVFFKNIGVVEASFNTGLMGQDQGLIRAHIGGAGSNDGDIGASGGSVHPEAGVTQG